MRKMLPFFLSLGITLIGCSDDGSSPTKAKKEDPEGKKAPVAVDYSAGRAMNKRLGKGINLGNSWDSQSWGKLDGGWGNPIDDGDFKIIKDAGFNSVRLPVRWNEDSDYETHTVNPDRLKGVKEDIQLALDQGLAVVVNFHHYTTLNDLGGAAFRGKQDSIPLFEAEKAHFLALWDQVSKELNKFPDSMVVLEILNEPTIPGADIVNDIMLGAYDVIRKNAPKKTIMFEAFHAAKFADLEYLTLPED
jgi:endoglucanase